MQFQEQNTVKHTHTCVHTQKAEMSHSPCPRGCLEFSPILLSYYFSEVLYYMPQ